MLNAIAVSLVDHNPAWAGIAESLADELAMLRPNLLAVHHIGSTAVPGLKAKPIIDLLPVVASLAVLDGQQSRIEALGYVFYGEYGIPGRRFYALPRDETRLVHLHFFESGSDQIWHNLAFRDYLRAHPAVAAAYAAEKQRARDLHPDNSHGYTAEKARWVQATSIDAHAWFAHQPAGLALKPLPA
ncbi:MAG: GrpB family protein [Polymorphobacter sp.]